MAINFDGKGNIEATTPDGVIAVKLYSLEKTIEQKDKEIERLNQYVDFYKDLSEKQNKKIESLKQINEDHQKLNGELRVENDRLNNIVNKIVNIYESEDTTEDVYFALEELFKKENITK